MSMPSMPGSSFFLPSSEGGLLLNRESAILIYARLRPSKVHVKRMPRLSGWRRQRNSSSAPCNRGCKENMAAMNEEEYI